VRLNTLIIYDTASLPEVPYLDFESYQCVEMISLAAGQDVSLYKFSLFVPRTVDWRVIYFRNSYSLFLADPSGLAF
jgi:hypothetical protein